MTLELDHLDVGGCRLACCLRRGRSPTLLFLPGYASDMDGAKAVALDAFAERRGQAMLRFDYSGTGQSAGSFEDGTLDRWLAEALAMLDQLTPGPVIAVGSSMGGWIALHLALQRPERVAALVGIAAAPDFTDWGFSDEQKAKLERKGSLCDDGQLVTREFWRSGQALRLLDRKLAIDCPVRLVHGELDSDVPLPVACRLLQQLHSADVQLTIVKA
ncbi:MAG: alpha/beta hydrolase, partial [Pseudomonadota bacterium]|nr:alpha/beta hydrolase [Pseudomonadota bacterium]